MIPEKFNAAIETAANMQRIALTGGTLFGHPIDVTNIDHVLAASYHLAEWNRLEDRFAFRHAP